MKYSNKIIITISICYGWFIFQCIRMFYNRFFHADNALTVNNIYLISLLILLILIIIIWVPRNKFLEKKLSNPVKVVSPIENSSELYADVSKFLYKIDFNSTTIMNELQNLDNLKEILQKNNYYIGLEKFSRISLHIREKTMGHNHPDTIKNRDELTSIIIKKKDFVKSEKLSKINLHIREKTVGRTHPDTIRNQKQLIFLLKKNRNYPEAIKLYKKMQRTKKKNGPIYINLYLSLNFFFLKLTHSFHNFNLIISDFNLNLIKSLNFSYFENKNLKRLICTIIPIYLPIIGICLLFMGIVLIFMGISHIIQGEYINSYSDILRGSTYLIFGLIPLKIRERKLFSLTAIPFLYNCMLDIFNIFTTYDPTMTILDSIFSLILSGTIISYLLISTYLCK